MIITTDNNSIKLFLFCAKLLYEPHEAIWNLQERMVLLQNKFFFPPIVKFLCKRTRLADIMTKRSLQNPPAKKLKSNAKLTNSSKDSANLGDHNLNLAALHFDKMQRESNQELGVGSKNGVTDDNSGTDVTYLKTPTKSDNDKKEYKVIQLKNGLTALLISDAHSITTGCEANIDNDNKQNLESAHASEDEEESNEDESDESDEDDDSADCESEDEEEENEHDQFDTDAELSTKRVKKEEKMAACGLCVGVGSFSDPPEIPGMAHFLEHMVFMGSEKYPQENDFDAFIKKRGGSDNASTECEQTTFYFEVQEKHLLSALDRFAQFFISPLMKRDAISREREAVESEFQMALPSDFYRRAELFCTFAKPSHPATKFTWGNLITLRDNITDDKLYEELHKFRERHYSAHRMTLAIQARLPLDTLEKYVTQCFSSVPNNGLPPDDFTIFKGANSFDTPNFKKMYKIKPINDVCQVKLTWALPPLLDLYKSKPHHYIAWIIGHEGKGSLISYLRKKMWCLDIFSGSEESGAEYNSMYALFCISLILTNEGHKNLKMVLDAVFSFINLLRIESPQKRIYDEIHQIEETSFRFEDEEPAADYVEDLCENMHFYPPEDYITGSELYFEYNPEAIKTCMNFLTAEDVNIIISDKKFNDEDFDKVEPWFKTKYKDTDIPNEWIACWKAIAPLPEFHLPLPNIFVTNDFSLITLPSDIPTYPVKIHADNISEVWYRPDPKFKLPECYMYFYIISPLTTLSPQNTSLMDLFVEILKQLLVEELYPATAAELHHEIYMKDKGIVIKLYGFNQNLPLLSTTIAKYIRDCQNLVTKELFDVMKEQQLKAYYNTFLKPTKLVKEARLSILMLTHWTAIDKHAAISGIEFDQFQNFVKYFINHIYIQCLVQGNMTKEHVIENVQKCVDILGCGPLLPNTAPQLRITKIPLGTHTCKVQNFNKTDVNSVVTNYYQSGIASIDLSVIIELLIMIMEEPLFNQLRTQEQLGYNVFCLMRDTFGILGYSITVCTQADKYTTEHIDSRIEEFLKSFNKILADTTEKELLLVKDALIKLKRCADLHLKEEVVRNWAEIISEQYIFDRCEKEIAAIECIKIDELRTWIANHTLDGNNLRKLSIQAVGTALKAADDVKNVNKQSSLLLTSSVDGSNTEESTAQTKYTLSYLPDVDPDTMELLKNCITDIQKYKRTLYAYPIQETKL